MVSTRHTIKLNTRAGPFLPEHARPAQGESVCQGPGERAASQPGTKEN